MCSHRVQKAGRRSSEIDDIWGRSRRGDGTGVAARQRALASAEGRNCKRKRRSDHVHRMGISGCVGGAATPKHYCAAGGVRIATPATPGGDCSPCVGMVRLGRFGQVLAAVGARRCPSRVFAWDGVNVPPNSAGIRGNGDQFGVGIAWIKRFGTYVGGGQCARFMASLMTGFARAATQQLCDRATAACPMDRCEDGRGAVKTRMAARPHGRPFMKIDSDR